jgi:hypothetical protein
VLHLSTLWPHLGAQQASCSLLLVWGGHGHRECPEKQNSLSQPLQFRPARRGIAEPSKLQRLQSCKTGITAQKEPAGDNTGVSRDNILKIHNTCSGIRLCSLQLRSAASAATITTKTATIFRKKIRNRTPVKSGIIQCKLKM